MKTRSGSRRLSRTGLDKISFGAGNGVLLFLALMGGVFAFCSAYRLEVERGLLFAFCAAMSLVSVTIWSMPKGRWTALLGALAVMAGAVWRLWADLVPAGLLFWKRIQAALAVETGAGVSFSAGVADRSVTAAVLLLTALLALVLGWAVAAGGCWYAVLGLTLLPVLPAMMAGILPDWWALMAAGTSWCTLLFTSLYRREDRRGLGRARWLSLSASCLLLAALTVLLPREGYQRPQWAVDSRNWLVETVGPHLAAYVDWEIPGLDGSGGPSEPAETEKTASAVAAVEGVLAGSGAGPVDLTAAGPRRYTGRTVLQVQGEETGRVYLRGASAAVYTGTSWQMLDAAEYADLRGGYFDEGAEYVRLYPLLYPAQTTPEAETLVMTVRHTSQSLGVVYSPYQLVWQEPEGLSMAEDIAVVRSAFLREYQVSYRPAALGEGDFTPLTGDWSEAEGEYSGFVVRNYLEVPRETAELLSPLLADLDRQAITWPAGLLEQYQQRVATALRAASLLSSLAVYDLNTPAMDPDGDFVEHFLTQGRGYCMHFATAGTLLLRLSGIPARYVSGYVADLDSSGAADVPDSAAHAWVEIYLDGYGWYPVEMTPAAYAGEDGEIPQAEPLPDRERPENVPAEAQDQLEQPDQTEMPPASAETERLDLGWLGWICLALLICALPFAARWTALALRRRRTAWPDTGRSAVAAYGYYQRLRRWGGGEQPELEELARKARFSQHTLTEEERTAAWTCAREAARQLESGLPQWKRLALCYLLLLL